MAGVQVVRVESYTKASMSGVGREQLRDANYVCRNADIDPSRTNLNVAFKSPAGGSIGSAWHTAFDDISPGYKERKGRNILYSLLQDSFHTDVGKCWGLGRGEIGSDARHESHHKRRTKKSQTWTQGRTGASGKGSAGT